MMTMHQPQQKISSLKTILIVRMWPFKGAGQLPGGQFRLRGSPSGQTKLRKMMDATKIAPLDNVDLVILRNSFDFSLI